MLQFNPYFRISITDALAHPCFKKIRKPTRELVADQVCVIDFEDQALDKDTLRQLYLRIVHEAQTDETMRKP